MSASDVNSLETLGIEEGEVWSAWPFTVAWAGDNTIYVVAWAVAVVLDILFVVYIGGLIYFEYDKENL